MHVAHQLCHISVYCVQWSHKKKERKKEIPTPPPPIASMYSRPTLGWAISLTKLDISGGCMHVYLSIGFSVGSSQKKKREKREEKGL